MRVLFVCADPGVPVFGCKGASVHVQEIARAMLRRGMDVVLAARCLGDGARRVLEGARVVTLPGTSEGDGPERERALADADGALAGILEDLGEFDLLYQRHSLWSCAALEHARGAGVPSVLEVNAPLVEEQARFRGLCHMERATEMERRAFSVAGRVACVSEAVAAYCLQRGADAARVRVVPNGVDPERFRPDVEPALPAPGGTVTVGLVSTLRPWHGVDTLIEAFARVAAGSGAWRLLIVGDGPLMQAVRDDLARRGLLDRAVLTGMVPPTDVPAWLTSMEIAVVPYRAGAEHYYSPLKLFEYMASGRAIVASRIGQVASVLEDGRTGLQCEPGDAAEMAAALERLASSADERVRLGRAARECAVREHSWDAVLERTLEGVVMNPLGAQGARP
jgi:glycosyltransferase involved in cell wall biosynthesis